jgi:hypothetical protein
VKLALALVLLGVLCTLFSVYSSCGTVATTGLCNGTSVDPLWLGVGAALSGAGVIRTVVARRSRDIRRR